MMPAPTKAQTEVILRPYLSSAYIMNRLAHGTAKFMPSVYWSDLVMLKPFACMMFGSQAPRPMATPKNAVKQIMPAMTRRGNMAEHDGERIAFGVAGRIGRERFGGAAMPSRPSTSSASWPLTVRRQIARRFRQREAEHPDDQRADADDQPEPRQTYSGLVIVLPKSEHERRPDRPYAGAADEMNDGQDASANSLGRIFAGIGESERLLGAEPEPGDEAADDQQA